MVGEVATKTQMEELRVKLVEAIGRVGWEPNSTK